MSINHSCKQCGAILSFEGLCYQCRQEQEREKYLSMTLQEIQQKKEYILQHMDEIASFDEAYHEFFNLFAYCGINTEEIAKAAFEKEIFYPAELYRDASPEIRDNLIERLQKTQDSHEANHIQCCLAMIPDDEEVLKSFLHLEKNPLPWRKELYVDPSQYAHQGGWTFDKEGNRISLVFPVCYPLVKGGSTTDKAIRVAQKREDNCEHCGSKMMDLLIIDGRDERLAFLEIDGIIKVTACPSCVSMCEQYHCRYTINGESEVNLKEPFADENYISEKDYEYMANNTFVLGKESVPLFFGCVNDAVNTIGGMPNWVQDTQYFTCPACGKPMKYFAQLHWDTIIDCAEGTLFMQICTDCSVISMVHQQT